MRVLLAALFLVPTVAFAQMPPPEYDRGYDGKLIEHRVPFGTARAYCRKMGRHQSMARYGCSLGDIAGPGTCTIVVSGPTQADVRNVRKHETAHCAGWPENHPNAR